MYSNERSRESIDYCLTEEARTTAGEVLQPAVRFEIPSVRPELVEGLRKGFSATARTKLLLTYGITSTLLSVRLFPAVIWIEGFCRNSSASSRATTVSR
jgi:hypothetical protein